MATTNGQGLHNRSKTAPTNKAAATEETVQVMSDHDKASGKGHPGGSGHGPLLQTARITGLFVYFFVCCLCMNATQFIGAPVYFYDMEWYYAWMALTKQHFALLLVTVQHWWTPTTIRVSWDKTVRGQLVQRSDGRLECDFPERLVLVANHELYTDWLYLWWIAYTSNMHGHIFIILKESLKYVPILGWGMQFFSFIFLSRNWTTDRQRFAHRLKKLRRPQGKDPVTGIEVYNPMWMLIFPEGTNLSVNGRKKSKAWADKTGIEDMQHTLLPRSTGLKFCLEELGESVEWIYDCTLAYEGIPRGQYGQDIYSLRSIYLQGRVPPTVNMHWRRFAVKDAPRDSKEFEEWVLARWREKDELVEHYMQHGQFPADDEAPEFEYKEVPNGAGVTRPVVNRRYIETEVRPGSALEVVQIFLPSLGLFLVLHLIRRLFRWLVVALTLGSRS